MKNYIDQNVYQAAMERIAYCFSEFDNVLVSFSGGKDSGVMLNLCYDYAKETGKLDKLSLYHLDYEAQYQLTTEYVERCFSAFPGVRKFWLCLPVLAQCAVNMTSLYWIPWQKSKQSIWCRDMPVHDAVINEENAAFDYRRLDYKVQDNFCKWFSDKYGKTAVMIGIRTQESLNRFRAIASDKKVNTYKRKKFIIGYGDENTFKCYPIYDWSVADIWIANAKFGYDYNKLYDLMYQAGLSAEQMRVASPFNDCATNSLKLYKVIEPHTWGKLLSRVNGVSFAGIYGGTTAMGWKSITKPKHLTWKEYCYFLLGTLPEDVRKIYEQKLETSIKFWREKGGALSPETVAEIEGVPGAENRGKISKISDKDVITFEEYPDELDVTNFAEVPSYKRMCVCIMKNDISCKYMGFAATKQEAERRRAALEKYKNL